VELLTAYSHTTHVADLQRSIHTRPPAAAPAAPPASKRPWSLRDRLDNQARADMIAAYRAGTAAASLATTYELSLRSVKRVLAVAGVRRKLRPS
jgi:hypothetical protein